MAVFILLLQLFRLVLGIFIRIDLGKEICKQGLYARPLFAALRMWRLNDADSFQTFL